ncbi:DUF418 domain-containing protein [Actinoalloteichus hymeniacidonis]|uniref:Membrane protein n=1 Tax=Actinoalloteichus hymeniacidonis TaxID=340345 RepID=A0AAC9HLD3_9PSEU|nr:DUF418 domain-containing protein [Actinoalloteichus hymeniacidonis]AOS61218.1 putative membrane protein [Actinoalloteichus hymeniacidonis]MBB5910779.1 putative membrane protein YeiB [Actinoalloteichus hymeniacidonis]
MTIHDDPPPQRQRAVAPDLARGLMLLFIALANVPWFLYGAPTALTSAHRADATGLDVVWQTIAIVAIDGRSYPLFAFLFGYGIWQLYTRQQAAGVDEKSARRLLQLRHLWMIVFGGVHAALLWQGDVLGAYGLCGLIMVWLFLRRQTATLRRWIIGLFTMLAIATISGSVVGLLLPMEEAAAMVQPTVPQLAGTESYLDSILPRFLFWSPLVVAQGLLGFVVPIAVLLAIVCARRRILESPETHRRLLMRTAVVGIAIGWLGAVPAALVHHGIWELPDWAPTLLHLLTGLCGGIGYAALFGLIAARFADGRSPGALVGGLTAIGKRSLSCYLVQSVIFAPLLAAWGLGLGATLTEWQAALIAVAAWLVSMVFAIALERAGKRGPAEWLLRRLAYRGRRSSATPVAR